MGSEPIYFRVRTHRLLAWYPLCFVYVPVFLGPFSREIVPVGVLRLAWRS